MRTPTLPSRSLCDPDPIRQLPYRSAAATDIRATFRRARALQQHQLAQAAAAADTPLPAPVTWLHRKA